MRKVTVSTNNFQVQAKDINQLRQRSFFFGLYSNLGAKSFPKKENLDFFSEFSAKFLPNFCCIPNASDTKASPHVIFYSLNASNNHT